MFFIDSLLNAFRKVDKTINFATIAVLLWSKTTTSMGQSQAVHHSFIVQALGQIEYSMARSLRLQAYNT